MLFTIVALFFVDFGVAFAQSSPNQAASGGTLASFDEKGFLSNIVNLAVMILKVAYAILIPVLGLIGKFLSNDWVTGSAFNVDIIIELLWQIVRNMVNIAIVFYLLFVAGKHIVPFGKLEDRDAIKKALPMVVVALLLVNFSLFGTRMILNFANLATTIAFSIPQQVVGNVFPNPNDTTGQKPYHMFVWATPISSELTNALSCPAGYTRKNLNDLTPDQQKAAKDANVVAAGGSSVCRLNEGCIKPDGTISQDAECMFAPSTSNQSSTQYSNGISPSQPTGSLASNGIASSIAGSSGNLNNGKVTPTSIYASVSTNATLAGGGDQIRQVECLHRNYAFNFDPSFVKAHNSSIIANPIYNGSSYDTGEGYYKRFIITISPRGAKGVPNPAYDEKMNEIAGWIRTTKASWTAGGLQAGDVSKGLSGYPYYSDCIMTMDELVFSARNVMFVYAFNLMKVAQYEQGSLKITDLSGVAVKYITTVAYFGFFVLVNIMLLIAVIGRAFYIWAMMILSPVWVLTEVMKLKASGEAQKAMDSLSVGRFVKLAFMPAVVGLILSLGFVMFHYLSYIGDIEGLYAGRLQLGSITLYFDTDNVIIAGLGHMFQLMFAFIAVAAVFLAAYEAIKFGFGDSNPFMTAITKIKTGATTGLREVAKMPLNANLIPLPGGAGKISLSSLKDLPGNVTDALSNRAANEAEKNDSMKRMQMLINPKMKEEMTNIAKQMQSHVENNKTESAKSFIANIQAKKEDPRMIQMVAEMTKAYVDSNGNVKRGDKQFNLEGQQFNIKQGTVLDQMLTQRYATNKDVSKQAVQIISSTPQNQLRSNHLEQIYKMLEEEKPASTTTTTGGGARVTPPPAPATVRPIPTANITTNITTGQYVITGSSAGANVNSITPFPINSTDAQITTHLMDKTKTNNIQLLNPEIAKILKQIQDSRTPPGPRP